MVRKKEEAQQQLQQLERMVLQLSAEHVFLQSQMKPLLLLLPLLHSP